MKQKKSGFTLIELLAVIVILAIIALIAVPVIMNIISKARKSAFEDTAYGLISAGEMYYASQLLEPNGMQTDVVFTIANGSFQGTNRLDVKGSLPTGTVKVTKDGKVALAVQNGINCITKDYDDSAITTTDYVEGQCYFPGTLAYLATTNDFATSVNACATTGTCAAGTTFAIKVNKTEVKNFYVVSDADDKVTLIMDSNLNDKKAWINQTDYTKAGGQNWTWTYTGDTYTGNNELGPITALDYLESQTSGWTNLPKGYTTIDDNTTHTNTNWETVSGPAYTAIARSNARARLLKKTEASALNCTISSGSCPDWLYKNLYTSTNTTLHYGYWLSSASADYSIGVWYVYYDGHVSSDGAVEYADGYGVRPVIEIPKSII